MTHINTINSQPNAYAGGVCGHSTPARWNDWAIFCVGNDPYREAGFTTWANGCGLKFKSLIGSYKGQQERSFLVSMADYERCIKNSGWIKQEESVLLLRPRRKDDGTLLKCYDAPIDAYLVYEGDRSEWIGLWQETHEANAKAGEGWTYDPQFGTWFNVYQPRAVN
jgi:hypothetical protein